MTKTSETRSPSLREYAPTDRLFFERGLFATLREESPFDPLKLVFPPRDWGRTHARSLLKDVRKHRGHVLVAQVGRSRAGFVVGAPQPAARGRNRSFDPSRHPCCIYVVYVVPRFRGRGIGNRLLEESERRLRAQGCDLVHMVALSGNERALSIYRTRGYFQRVLWLGKWLRNPD